jgi:hypothetical protein
MILKRMCFLSLAVGIFSCSYWWDLKIINNPAYSIGLISSYTPPSSAHVAFEYNVKGTMMWKGYSNGAHRWNVPSNGVHIGDEFMVQYDSLDPGSARMLFSYPLKDSTDFKKYVTLFKKSPPGYPSP